MSVSIRDFPDAGIIYAIEDNTGDDGYADVVDVASALGQDNAKGLGVRLSWMQGFGMVERHRHKQGRWKVSKSGERAVKSTSSACELIAQSSRTKSGAVEFDILRRTVQHYKPRKK